MTSKSGSPKEASRLRKERARLTFGKGGLMLSNWNCAEGENSCGWPRSHALPLRLGRLFFLSIDCVRFLFEAITGPGLYAY